MSFLKPRLGGVQTGYKLRFISLQLVWPFSSLPVHNGGTSFLNESSGEQNVGLSMRLRA